MNLHAHPNRSARSQARRRGVARALRAAEEATALLLLCVAHQGRAGVTGGKRREQNLEVALLRSATDCGGVRAPEGQDSGRHLAIVLRDLVGQHQEEEIGRNPSLTPAALRSLSLSAYTNSLAPTWAAQTGLSRSASNLVHLLLPMPRRDPRCLLHRSCAPWTWPSP